MIMGKRNGHLELATDLLIIDSLDHFLLFNLFL